MKLKALRLHGFKSFADRTEVVFHDGITAVVGPNGCGKSNISDAIRWVLGEQRPSAIRGARMEEAIFQGTVSRRPVNRGSVAIEVSNEGGILPVPFGEVEIARTVYRDGGSEYLLNRSVCRLRDIQDLCRDTGLGSNAYAIIEGRMIDAILSDRAEERRGLFEEAAGVGKYKDRRRAAARRLERAEIDVQRLDDLIAEIESKVRSLARQKGRAERWAELRGRRLDAEVALARAELGSLEARKGEIARALESDVGDAVAMSAGLQAAESRVETLRLERAALDGRRADAARALEEVRRELVTWERELAVAEERATNAERRLQSLDGEREEARKRAEEATSARGELAVDEERIAESSAGVARALETERLQTARIRAEYDGVRSELDRIEEEEREIARGIARLGGDAEASLARAAEMEHRLRLLEEEREVAAAELREMNEQGDLFGDRLGALASVTAAAREGVEGGVAEVEALSRALDEARTRAAEIQEGLAGLRGRHTALERMEADGEGVDPVIRALLAADLPGVHGILTDAIRAPADIGEAVERYLGELARGVVVESRDTALEVARWFREVWKKGGGIVLLPLDAVPASPSRGKGSGADSLLARIDVDGKAAAWARALLEGVRLESDGGLGAAGAVVTTDGIVVDARGSVRLGNPTGASGLLERKEALRALTVDLAKADSEMRETTDARDAAHAALRGGEARLEALRGRLREAEDAERETRTEESERARRRERIDRTVADLDQQVEMTRAGALRAREQAASASEEKATREASATGVSASRARAREEAEAARKRWEEARVAETRLEVDAARIDMERTRLADRLRALGQTIESEQRRLEALEKEDIERRAELERSADVRTRGGEAIQALFARREEAEGQVSVLERSWSELEAAVAEGERAARAAREAERAATDRRHGLELEAGEVSGRIARVQERLEVEWGRSLAELLEEATDVEGTEEELRAEVRDVVDALARLGPVNQLAVEEHEEESARLAFLREQHGDLVRARNDLKTAIREINQTATRLFHETFEQIREHFRATFLRLFEGGECDLWLVDPEDPLDSPIEIHASPRGKRTQRIDLLSGGERALTALSLLFGIYLVKPSPFCVLDEVDAPLDESNIGRFIHLLQEFKSDTQFVVITHNPRTIEAADWIYGVTMEEPGVSRIVGVRLEEALEVAAAGS